LDVNVIPFFRICHSSEGWNPVLAKS